jgi:hypothetical protein
MGKTVSKPKGAKPVLRGPRAGSDRSHSGAMSVFSSSTLWVSLVLIAVNLIVFSPTWHFGFLTYDDPLYVSNNAEVARGLNLQNIFWAFMTSHAASWRRAGIR